MVSHPNINQRCRKYFVLSTLFAVSASIAQVRGVVMIAPQSTRTRLRYLALDKPLDYDEGLLPHRYNISTPIIAVPKYKMYVGNSSTEWTHAWQYQSENVAVFAYQSYRDTMEDRFVIDENVGDTGVSLYAVFDGFDGNFTVDYLAYGFMDKLRNKIINIKKAKQGDTSNTYIYPNGSINYNKLLHEEVLAADKHISLTCKSNDSIEYYFDFGNYCISGSTAIVAVIDGDHLFVANVGDSYGVMCGEIGNVTPLVKEHNFFKNRKEVARCKEAAKDLRGHPDFIGASRVIGDSKTRKAVAPYVISDPEVFTYDLYKCKCKFIVLASDGIYRPFLEEPAWHSMDKADQPIVTYLNQYIETNLLEAMKNLTLHMHPFPSHLEDNQTIMVVKTNIRNK